jgi:cholesterol oxidase
VNTIGPVSPTRDDAIRYDADVLVIGSGFGGSVAALRATEKGHRVVVLEAGRRFADGDLPKTTWDLRRFLWAPRLGCTGIQRVRLLRDVLVLSGAGVGGGSLVYANTLYSPPAGFYRDPQWRGITDWQAELAPHLDQASRMLGVADNPDTTVADEVLKEVATDLGVGSTFRLTPVGVFFGDGHARRGATVPDPFFGGAGPERTVCTRCGSCMSGCRVGAKNTLPKNYLWLAEHAGAQIRPLTTVTDLRQDADGAWLVRTVPTGAARTSRRAQTLRAREVVLAAGALGTQQLLQRLAAAGRHPGLSSRIGELTRTNSEAIHAAVRDSDSGPDRNPEPHADPADPGAEAGSAASSARRRSADHSRGIAISSSIHPDEHTHVEPCRYGRGSNLMALLGTVLVSGDSRSQRLGRFASAVARHPVRFASGLSVRRWSERGFVLLTMQSHDNSITVSPGRTGRLTSRPGPGVPSPRSIPQAHEVTRRVAAKIGGRPQGSWTELADIPVTAHILGGAVIGVDATHGVVDPWQRVFGAPGLHVLDGAAVSANLGVNPSLTITAQAERAMSFWPNLGSPDPRPAVGQPYRLVPAVPPRTPAVPAGAPAALLREPVPTA